MKTRKHLVALAESDEASMPEATIKENGIRVRKQANCTEHRSTGVAVQPTKHVHKNKAVLSEAAVSARILTKNTFLSCFQRPSETELLLRLSMREVYRRRDF